MRLIFALALLAAVLLLTPARALSSNASNCEFVLGFKTLQGLITQRFPWELETLQNAAYNLQGMAFKDSEVPPGRRDITGSRAVIGSN